MESMGWMVEFQPNPTLSLFLMMWPTPVHIVRNSGMVKFVSFQTRSSFGRGTGNKKQEDWPKILVNVVRVVIGRIQWLGWMVVLELVAGLVGFCNHKLEILQQRLLRPPTCSWQALVALPWPLWQEACEWLCNFDRLAVFLAASKRDSLSDEEATLLSSSLTSTFLVAFRGAALLALLARQYNGSVPFFD